MRAWAWPICAHLAGIAVHMVPHGRMGTNLLCSKTSWLFRMPQVGSPERRTDIGQYNAFSRCLQIEEFVVGQCFVWIFAGKQDCRLPWPQDAQVAGEAHASVNQWFYWVPELIKSTHARISVPRTDLDCFAFESASFSTSNVSIRSSSSLCAMNSLSRMFRLRDLQCDDLYNKNEQIWAQVVRMVYV